MHVIKCLTLKLYALEGFHLLDDLQKAISLKVEVVRFLSYL